MKHVILVSRMLPLALIALVTITLANPQQSLLAQEEPAATEEAPKVDMYLIPENATKEQLVEVIEGIVNFEPDSLESYTEYRQKAPVVLEQAAQMLMAAVNDKTSVEYRQAQGLYIQLLAAKISKVESAEAKEIVDQLIGFFSDRPLELSDLQLAHMLASNVEQSGSDESAKRLYKFFSEAFAKNENKQIEEFAEQFAGSFRRLDLVGNKMKIEGKTFEGDDFNVDQFAGKVVLVDFWATWCGPCIAEIPNVKENYEKYHDRGFEVIAISLDSDRAALGEFLEREQLPWKCLHEDGVDGNHPAAAYYGISSIPQVILIGKDGNVVTLNARGPRLGELLEEMLGDKS